jgi:transposase
MSVADLARRHRATRWQIYGWRKKLRNGQLVVPESLATLPMFAELVVVAAAEMPAETEVNAGVEIVVGNIAIRVGADDPPTAIPTSGPVQCRTKGMTDERTR